MDEKMKSKAQCILNFTHECALTVYLTYDIFVFAKDYNIYIHTIWAPPVDERVWAQTATWEVKGSIFGRACQLSRSENF